MASAWVAHPQEQSSFTSYLLKAAVRFGLSAWRLNLQTLGCVSLRLLKNPAVSTARMRRLMQRISTAAIHPAASGQGLDPEISRLCGDAKQLFQPRCSTGYSYNGVGRRTTTSAISTVCMCGGSEGKAARLPRLCQPALGTGQLELEVLLEVGPIHVLTIRCAEFGASSRLTNQVLVAPTTSTKPSAITTAASTPRHGLFLSRRTQ